MALAVTAMIGSCLQRGNLRISRIVSMPSISGIMMSISTMSMSGSACSRRIASRPFSADTITMSCASSTVDSAKMLRMSSSTISTFLPASKPVGLMHGLHRAPLPLGHAGHAAMQEEGGGVDQLFRRLGDAQRERRRGRAPIRARGFRGRAVEQIGSCRVAAGRPSTISATSWRPKPATLPSVTRQSMSRRPGRAGSRRRFPRSPTSTSPPRAAT